VKRYKVIQWASGNVGQHALRALIANPMYELVGLWVSSPEKAGRDAGELAGLPPTGIIGTNDADALLALDADVVSYMAGADSRPLEAVADWVRILESGKNIVTTSMAALTYPPAADPDMRRALEAACVRGGASLFNSGTDPPSLISVTVSSPFSNASLSVKYSGLWLMEVNRGTIPRFSYR